MITLLTYDNVRQTIINADLKRFTDDIRTIRRPTVANLRKSYPQPNPKLSTRMITLLTYDNVRQTIINADLKRFTDDIRTIRRPTVANVRKSYPQSNKSYPHAQ